MENQKFCPLPWIFQAVRNNGDIRVCCQANASKSKGIFRKSDGTPFNAAKDNLEDARNSELVKSIRRSMLNNECHEACIRCDREDQSGVRSRRKYENENWKDIFDLEKAKTITAEDGGIVGLSPMFYDLRFGNLCNLKCRMCGPTDSNRWYGDFVSLWGNEFQDSHGKVSLVKGETGKYITLNNDYNWVDSESFWSQLEKKIENIRHIHTVGGEPLLIEKQYRLLEKCIEKGYAKNITIEYNSNITVLPKRALKVWKHFKKVKIGASIDGFGKINDMPRFIAISRKITFW